jgi:prophage regulatory protein
LPSWARKKLRHDFYLRATVSDYPTSELLPFPFWDLSRSFLKEQEPRRWRMTRGNGAPIKRTIRRHQLREMVPLADSTIYEMEQRGEFPRRFALSPRCVVWDLAEVEAWLAARRASPVRRAQHPDVRQRRARPVRERDQARGEASKAG